MPLLHHQSTEWAVCDQLSLSFFPPLFPSAPYRVLFDFIPHLRGWAGRFNQITDHMDLEHLKHVTHIVVVTEPPVTLSKSLQVAPYIQILKLGKHTLIANPIYWPHTLFSVDKKQDRKATGWAKDSPGGSESFREKSVLGKSYLMTFRSTGPHTSPMGWGHHFILGNTVVFLRAERVVWSLQSTSALVPK